MDQANMGKMNGYYDSHYSAEDLRRVAEMSGNDAMMGILHNNGMDPSGMMGMQTLDDIINQNKELQRRRSYHQMHSFGSTRANQAQSQDQGPRRPSLLNFESGSSSELDGFQFDPTPSQSMSNLHGMGSLVHPRLNSQVAQRAESSENLALNNHFQALSANYSSLPPSSAYPQPLRPSEPLGLDIPGTYMPDSMLATLEYQVNGMEQDCNGNMTTMAMFPQTAFASNITTSPLQQELPNSIGAPAQDSGVEIMNDRSEQEGIEKLQMAEQMQDLQVDLPQSALPMHSPALLGQLQSPSDYQAPSKTQRNANLDVSSIANGISFPSGETNPSSSQALTTQYPNAYSSSGFDMLEVLTRVATRPKPQINIGAVDMSCAFVVCDYSSHDCPIVYCSDNFERLTGYSKHEILGRNCRFLQAPDGKIQAGIKRKYVDDQAVLRIKNMISQGQEAQISVINYRKGGQPFMNLLTMIPITWDTDEIKYYVGFQVDLVEQPASITNKNPGE